MMTHGDMVMDEERYARNVYDPRNIDEKGILKEPFISLRTFQDGTEERGVSGQIYDRVSEEDIIENGIRFIRKKNNGEPKERYVGFALAKVGDIRAVAGEDDEIDVVLTESEIPAHAEIVFRIEGVYLQGKNRNSRYLKYCDDLKELLNKDIRRVTISQ